MKRSGFIEGAARFISTSSLAVVVPKSRSVRCYAVLVNDLDGMTEYVDTRLTGLPIRFVANDNWNASSILVLMPAALQADRSNRKMPVYARWSWHDSWPNSLVIAFADPAMQQNVELDGAWFLHPVHDVTQALADIVGEFADRSKVSREKIVFYGSSLGGFGALCCASHLVGARALADVPQIDIQNWIPKAIGKLERLVLQESLTEFRSRHPERISVTERFIYEAHIPAFKIISNLQEPSLKDQQRLIDWCSQSSLTKTGTQSIEMNAEVSGHRQTSRQGIVKLIGL